MKVQAFFIAFCANDKPVSMILFKGFQGCFPCKHFVECPGGDFQKSESGTTFHCLPICISTYHFGPSLFEVTSQLPDKLSESKIPANSSGIKTTCAQFGQKLKLVIISVAFVQNLHELTSCQVDERYDSNLRLVPKSENSLGRYFDLSQIGKQGKPVQVYKFASSVNRALFTTFAHPLVGATSSIPFEHHLVMMAARSF